MKRIITIVVIAIMLGNVLVVLSPNATAGNAEISDVNVDADIETNDIIESIIIEPVINRRITIYEEESASPVMVCGDDDVLHMAWIDSRNPYANSTTDYTTIFYKQSYDYGNTWTSDTPLSVRVTTATSVDMAIDGNYLAIVWEEGCSIFTMYSYDNGFTWADPYRINSVEDPSVALKENDIFIVFKAIGQTNPYLSGQKLTISPGLQSPVVVNINPTGGNQIASIADVTADENSVHVAIKDQSNSELHYYKSNDNGTSWSGGVIGNSFGADTIGSLDIANKEDSVNIIWSDNRDGNYNLFLKSSDDAGHTWHNEKCLINTVGDSTNLDVTVDSNSELNICWEEDSGTSNQIFYAKFDNAGNEAINMPITDGTSKSTKPSVAVDSDDYFYALWQDDRDDNDEIYFSTDLGEFDKQIDSVIEYISFMPDDYFSKKADQQKNTLINKMGAVRDQLSLEEYSGALNKLENDILKMIEKDIVDTDAQDELAGMISGLITAIEIYTTATEPIGGSEWCDIGSSQDTLVQPNGGLRRHSYEWSIAYLDGSRNFRVGEKYCNFWLDIENQNWATNINYRLTFVFKASAKIEIKQLSGSSWTNYKSIGHLPGNGNWRTCSLETNFKWNYDASSANSNYNILFEFESSILLDSISVIPVEYNCDVGEAYDNSLVSHEPGVCLYPNSEWQIHSDFESESCKLGVFSSSGNGPNILANLPNSNQEYRLTIRYHILADTENYGDIYLQLYKGSWPYINIGKLTDDDNDEWKTSIFIIEKNDYYDFISGGMVNLLFQFGFSPAEYSNIGDLILIDSIKLTAARDYCDVGTSNDNVATSHEPGASIYPNSEWYAPSTKDGRSCRYGKSYSNIYLNDIDTSKDYVIRITYRSPSNSGTPTYGYFRQYDGYNKAYRTLGKYIADDAWHTETFIAKAFWNYDYNGANPTYAMNSLFEFSRRLWVDEISVGVMEKYAILIGGGDTTAEDNHAAFKNDFSETYIKLKQYNDWKDENMYCFLWDQVSDYYYNGNWVDIDGMATNYSFINATIEIGNKITEDDFFLLVEVSHGIEVASPDDGTIQFYKDVPGGDEKHMRISTRASISNPPLCLKNYLDNNIDNCARSVIIAQSCYSGYAPLGLRKSNRIIMSATQTNEESWTTYGKDHWAFLYGAISSAGNMGSPETLEYFFDKGYKRARDNFMKSTPQIYNRELAQYTYI